MTGYDELETAVSNRGMCVGYIINHLSQDISERNRRFHADEPRTYTVWNMKTNARKYNRGSRVDFVLAGSGSNRRDAAAPANAQVSL